MDGGVAGTGAANLQDALPHSDLPPGGKASAHAVARAGDRVEDQIATSLLSLANPRIGELLEEFEQARETLDPELLAGLLRAAVTAAASRNLNEALAAISELIALDPERGAQLVRDSASLAPYRNQVDDLLQRLGTGAKSEAERTLRAASLAMEAGGAPSGQAATVYAQMLALAQRFVDTGQHINFVRATEIGQAVLAWYPEIALQDVNRASGKPKTLAGQPPQPLWRRAPFLILVLGSVALILLSLLLLTLRR